MVRVSNVSRDRMCLCSIFSNMLSNSRWCHIVSHCQLYRHEPHANAAFNCCPWNINFTRVIGCIRGCFVDIMSVMIGMKWWKEHVAMALLGRSCSTSMEAVWEPTADVNAHTITLYMLFVNTTIPTSNLSPSFQSTGQQYQTCRFISFIWPCRI